MAGDARVVHQEGASAPHSRFSDAVPCFKAGKRLEPEVLCGSANWPDAMPDFISIEERQAAGAGRDVSLRIN